MRSFCYALGLATLAACASGAPMATPQPLDGAWVLDSASPGVPPRSMTLAQRGATVTGTGHAMGVDAPIPFDITGTYGPNPADGPPAVGLHFVRADGGSMTADFQGTLSSGRLAGSVVYYGITSQPQPGTLSFRRP